MSWFIQQRTLSGQRECILPGVPGLVLVVCHRETHQFSPRSQARRLEVSNLALVINERSASIARRGRVRPRMCVFRMGVCVRVQLTCVCVC